MSELFKTAFLFIGQSPRPDMMDEVRAMLGEAYKTAEYGALDGLDDAAIAAAAPLSDEDTLVTKLRGGQTVLVSARTVEKLLERQAAHAVKDGAGLIALMCTGEFRLECPVPVITADEAFHKLQKFPSECRKIGVIVPESEQEETFASYYEAFGLPILTGHADPYGDDAEIGAEASRLAEQGADIICLDCMGYTLKQAGYAAGASGKEVRIPRMEIVRTIKERT